MAVVDEGGNSLVKLLMTRIANCEKAPMSITAKDMYQTGFLNLEDNGIDAIEVNDNGPILFDEDGVRTRQHTAISFHERCRSNCATYPIMAR